MENKLDIVIQNLIDTYSYYILQGENEKAIAIKDALMDDVAAELGVEEKIFTQIAVAKINAEIKLEKRIKNSINKKSNK